MNFEKVMHALNHYSIQRATPRAKRAEDGKRARETAEFYESMIEMPITIYAYYKKFNSLLKFHKLIAIHCGCND
jgi:hypothetical protein